MSNLTIHTVQGAYPANLLAKQQAEKFLAIFPNVEVEGPPPAMPVPPHYPPQSFGQPQPQLDTFSQPQSHQFYAQPTWQGQPMQPFQQQQPFSKQRFSTWFRQKSLKAKFGIGCASIIGLLLLCSFCGVISNVAGLNANIAPTPTTAPAQVVDQPTQDNSQVLDTPTDVPTTAPTPSPTPTATPVPTHPPLPTPRPTQPPPKPTPCPGVNCNPWGYNFSPGNEIFNPPANFCAYFNCIPSFWGPDDPGDGYINECVDGTYSQSGGERGDCSSHGGELRPLYSH